jgi:hypothetical protein
MKEMLQAFRDVFPGSQVVGEVEPQWGRIVSLGCSYKGELRVVNSEICKWHLAGGDEYCVSLCDNEWVAKRLKKGVQVKARKPKAAQAQKAGMLWG